MLNTPTSGHGPALPAAHDFATIEGRVAACCDWFDLEPPSLAYDPDEPDAVLLTQDFLEWMIASAVSLDWLVCGDVKGLVIGFRKDEIQCRAFLDVMKHYDAVEIALLVKAIETYQTQPVPFEEALEEWKREVGDYRAGLAQESEGKG